VGDAGCRASGGGILAVGAGGIVVEGRRGFDSEGGDVGQWRGATAAYDGRLGELERGKEDDVWAGLLVGIGGEGLTATGSVGGGSRGELVHGGADDIGDKASGV
jgi:hypothetical protein